MTGPYCRNELCHRAHRDHGPDGECLAAGAYGSHWNPEEDET